MFYTYVLRCGDGNVYVGSTGNLRRRVVEHQAARVTATASQLPVTLEYYEECRSGAEVRLREKAAQNRFRTRISEAASDLVAPLRVAMRAGGSNPASRMSWLLSPEIFDSELRKPAHIVNILLPSRRALACDDVVKRCDRKAASLQSRSGSSLPRNFRCHPARESNPRRRGPVFKRTISLPVNIETVKAGSNSKPSVRSAHRTRSAFSRDLSRKISTSCVVSG